MQDIGNGASNITTLWFQALIINFFLLPFFQSIFLLFAFSSFSCYLVFPKSQVSCIENDWRFIIWCRRLEKRVQNRMHKQKEITFDIFLNSSPPPRTLYSTQYSLRFIADLADKQPNCLREYTIRIFILVWLMGLQMPTTSAKSPRLPL